MAIPTAWRRMFASTFTLVAIGTASTHVAHAQTSYPSRPVTMVVPYPAGGANDMFGRLLGQKMGESLHASFIVENRPGAGALIGASFVARAPADGYTLLLGGLATHAASPNLLKADYDPLKAFEPIGMIGRAPIVVITSNDSPYKSLKEVVEAARKNPEGIMYGSSGNGSPLHLAGEQFLAIAKVKMTHVPYKGGNAHILDLLGGRIPVIFDTATNAMPLIKGGKVRALAVGTPNRLPELPNVPTIAEEGYPQFQFSAWYALFAPANTPKEIAAKLTEALGKALKDPTVVKKFGDLGVTVANPDPQELAKFLPGEYERIGSLIKTAKIKAD